MERAWQRVKRLCARRSRERVLVWMEEGLSGGVDGTALEVLDGGFMTVPCYTMKIWGLECLRWLFELGLDLFAEVELMPSIAEHVHMVGGQSASMTIALFAFMGHAIYLCMYSDANSRSKFSRVGFVVTRCC